MISEGAARKVEGWIGEAVAGGAELLTGGRRQGSVVEPTVLTNVGPEMKVCTEEVFAPVVTVEPFDAFSAAVAAVNRSRYGLQAGVFSNTLNHVLEAFRDLEVGGVIVNDVPTYRMDHMPYGGVKDSGFGREGVRYAIESMTELRLLALGAAL
jgi:glyceraldehyde-3-phosphate dehydrogenase (NADP+)